MEIKKENIMNAYVKGDNSVKEMLRTMFPDIEFETAQVAKKRLVTERIKTFADALMEMEGKTEEEWAAEHNTATFDTDVLAYLKLRCICAALNEGWQPEFTKDECRYYPWYYLWTEDELKEKGDEWKQKYNQIPTDNYITKFAGLTFAASSYSPSHRAVRIGSKLCLKSAELAEYCGKQFIDLWADFYLIRK